MPYEPYRLIPLRRRDGRVRAYAIVDESDYEWVNARRWSLHSGGYAQRGATICDKRTSVHMHRAILGLEPGDPRESDHKNGNRLDNRRENLRIVSKAGNAQNRHAARGSSRYVGVFHRVECGTWTAKATVSGRVENIGTFATELDAAAAAAQWRHANMPYAVEDPVLLSHVVQPRLGRIRGADRADEIVRRWHEGESMQAIADALGFTRNALGSMMTRLRAAGCDLPHRNPVVAHARLKAR